MPAVHSAHGIGVDRECKVLMHAAFLPEDSLRVGIVALERLDAFDLTKPPPPIAQLIQIDKRGRPSVGALIILQSPAAEVMRARDNARPDAFGRPYSNDEVPYFCAHTREVAGLEAKLRSVLGVHPQRIRMRDLVKPFGISGSR